MANSVLRYAVAFGLAFGCAVAIGFTLSFGNEGSSSDEWSDMASEVKD